MYYLIENTLRECTPGACLRGERQYVAVLTPEEWQKERDTVNSLLDYTLQIRDTCSSRMDVKQNSIIKKWL